MSQINRLSEQLLKMAKLVEYSQIQSVLVTVSHSQSAPFFTRDTLIQN